MYTDPTLQTIDVRILARATGEHGEVAGSWSRWRSSSLTSSPRVRTCARTTRSRLAERETLLLAHTRRRDEEHLQPIHRHRHHSPPTNSRILPWSLAVQSHCFSNKHSPIRGESRAPDFAPLPTSERAVAPSESPSRSDHIYWLRPFISWSRVSERARRTYLPT